MAKIDAGQTFQLRREDLAEFERNGFIGPVKVYSPEEMTERWKTIQIQLSDRSHAIYAEPSGKTSSISNYDRHLDIDFLSEHIMRP
jgi:non-haem Fe2+, alpha-ketoglutarate-dependent halogenase